MTIQQSCSVVAFLSATVFLPASALAAPKDQETNLKAAAMAPMDGASAEKLIAQWPNRPKLGAQQMIAQYGMPQEATSERLTWLNQGKFKRIVVTKEENPHDFPKPHMDYIQHIISYQVPAAKAGALAEYDGSLTYDRTVGEMAARCDLEGHNILTLNLAHDIVTGKKSAEDARKAFGQNVVDDVMGKMPAYVTALQFEPPSQTADADKPTMPGAPKRVTKAAGKDAELDDAAILSMIIAVDENEVVAASEAERRKLRPEVLAYAKMLHKAHGKSADDTMKLGQKINTTPTDTAVVEELRMKGAGELAAIVPMEGDEFGRAYVDAMVKGHTDVLATIDNKLLKSVKSEALKKHLTETRAHVAHHLDEAKKLQANAKR